MATTLWRVPEQSICVILVEQCVNILGFFGGFLHLVLQIRVIAVVQRSEAVTYQCHICCQKQIYITEADSYIQKSHFGFPYGTSHIMCPVPTGCETPSRITLTSAGAASYGSYSNVLNTTV